MEGSDSLDRVVRRTLAAVEEGQEALFGMAERARSEAERLQSALEAAAERDPAACETAAGYGPAAGGEQLERELGRLLQAVEQSGLLLTRFGVALQCLQGALPGGEPGGDWTSRRQVGQLVIQMLDNERRRIAREIHDGPAQTLANILLRAIFCGQRLAGEPESIQGELLGLKEAIRGSLREIRKILFDLRPKDLEQGLVSGLRGMIDDYQERYGLHVLFICSGQEKSLSRPAASALFRIVQESLNNVYKHSCSDHALVRLEMEEQRVNLHIYDDGKGFDLQEAAQGSGHYGLTSMRERARLLDGALQINTAPGQGTQVIVTIPIMEGDGELG